MDLKNKETIMTEIPQTPLEILESARALIEDEDNWITRAMFCSEFVGYSNEIDSDEFRYADKFCSLGALIKCSNDLSDKVGAVGFLGRASEEILKNKAHDGMFLNVDLFTAAPITAVNDKLGHKYVMYAYDMAIEEAKRQFD